MYEGHFVFSQIMAQLPWYNLSPTCVALTSRAQGQGVYVRATVPCGCQSLHYFADS